MFRFFILIILTYLFNASLLSFLKHINFTITINPIKIIWLNFTVITASSSEMNLRNITCENIHKTKGSSDNGEIVASDFNGAFISATFSRISITGLFATNISATGDGGLISISGVSVHVDASV